MNKFQKLLAWAYLNKKVKEGDKMFIFLKGVIAWIFKNSAIIIGIAEVIPVSLVIIVREVAKLFVSIASATVTKRDDELVPKVNALAEKLIAWIDKAFSVIKKACYTISDFVAGKEKYIAK